MIFRGHLLPYSWLYNSNSYLILSIIIPILSLIVGLNFANYFLVTMMIVLEIIFSILLSFENRKYLKISYINTAQDFGKSVTVSHQFITKPDVLVSNLSFSHIREIMVLELFYQERDNEKI